MGKPRGSKYCPALTDGGQQGLHSFEYVEHVVIELDATHNQTIATTACKYCGEERLESKVFELAIDSDEDIPGWDYPVLVMGEFDPFMQWIASAEGADGLVVRGSEEWIVCGADPSGLMACDFN